ncbi:hypothetical protein CPB86DRAFT_869268 [Serendipita vermifera]|nr:hypothetical protein CPB86DRAFT_869268 [Serendipita vermifera]
MSVGNTTIDDADPRVIYSSSPAWNTGIWSGQKPQPLYASNHGTPNPGATATLTFEGTGIRVYGFKAGDHGFRDITIDDGPTVRCDGRQGAQGGQALVYWAEGLSPGTHTIKFEHTGTQGQYLNLDFFLITQPPPSTPPPHTDPPSDSSSDSSPTSSTPSISSHTDASSSSSASRSTPSGSSISSHTSTHTGTLPATTASNSTFTSWASISSYTDTPPDSNIASNDPTSGGSQVNIAAITGGVAGAAILALVLAIIYIFDLRRKKRIKAREAEEGEDGDKMKLHPSIAPWAQDSPDPLPRILIPSVEIRKPPYPSDTESQQSLDRSPASTAGHGRVIVGSPSTPEGDSLTRRSTSGHASSSGHASGSGHGTSTTLHPPSHKSPQTLYPPQTLQPPSPSNEQQNNTPKPRSTSLWSRSGEAQALNENTHEPRRRPTSMEFDEGSIVTPLDIPPPYISIT